MSGKRFTIVNVIPPRPGSVKGTLVLDPDERPPVESITMPVTWLRSTHCRIGGKVSFMAQAREEESAQDHQGYWLRYHWEELPVDLQRVGFMDELRPKRGEQHEGDTHGG